VQTLLTQRGIINGFCRRLLSRCPYEKTKVICDLRVRA